MKAFEYAAPRSEAEVVEFLSAEPGKTAVLAGGTDLVVLMKSMIATPDRVVNIMEVPSLKRIEQDQDGSLVVGATVTLDELLDHPYLADYPAIRQAIQGIASPQFQAQGTLGGEICQQPQCWFFRNGRGMLAEDGKLVEHGDNRFHAILGNSGPAKFVHPSRIAPALIALGAQIRVLGPQPDTEAWMPIESLFRAPRYEGQRELALAPNQLVTHFRIPAAAAGGNATYEVRHGAGPDYPLAAAAVALQFRGDVVSGAKVVLGHVAPTPWIAAETARFLLGQIVTQEVADAAGRAAVAQAAPLSENGYKVQLAKTAVKRAILLAAGLETGGF